MDLVVYDDDEKRYVPWAVALAAVLLVALLTAVLTFVLARQASGGEASQAVGGVTSPEPATAPSAAATPTPAAPSVAPTTAAPTTAAPTTAAPTTAAPTTEAPVAEPTSAPACDAALLRADEALERAVGVDEALTSHTEIIDELLAERIDTQEALDRALPVLTDGATERRRFEEAVTDYQSSREDCRS